MLRCRWADNWLSRYTNVITHDRYKLLCIPPASANKRVKIAILDSGVNPLDACITPWMDRVTYKDFVLGDHEDPQDIACHGTHTTSVLLHAAPNAHVYVARIIGSIRPNPPSMKFQVDFSIIEAVSHPYSLPSFI